MNNTKITWSIIGIIVVLMIAGTIIFSDSDTGDQNGAELPVQGEAPSFSLNNYEGETVTLGDFSGKIKVINSWAVWCPFCKDELPDFARLQKEYPEQIAVIAIDRQESRQKAKGFTDSIGVTDDLVFLLDPQDSFYRKIGGFSMPETIFVDTDNNIRIHKRGPMEFSEMKQKIEQMLEISDIPASGTETTTSQ